LASTQNTKQVISISRRTDILAFYSTWLQKILNEKIVETKNPFNNKTKIILLNPDNVLGFVFWSRYPKALLSLSNYIDQTYGRNHYINFTITDYPYELEPRKPYLSKVLYLVNFLFDKYGEKYIHWRFDPIIISNYSPKEFIIEKFSSLCKLLEGKTRRCITSFIDIYTKVARKFSRNSGLKVIEVEFEEKAQIVDTLKQIAQGHNIDLYLCCESELGRYLNIPPASCVNPYLFELQNEQKFNISPTREGCTCYKSIDIGFYNSCLFDCLYCYSNVSYKSSLKNYLKIVKNKFTQF